MRFKTVPAWVGAFLLASSVGAAARTYVTFVDAALRVHPGFACPPWGVVPAGAPINVDRCVGAWCRIRASGFPGYVPAALIAFEAPPPAGN